MGFSGFVSGSGWQTITFALTGLRGQNVPPMGFEVNIGDLLF